MVGSTVVQFCIRCELTLRSIVRTTVKTLDDIQAAGSTVTNSRSLVLWRRSEEGEGSTS